MTKTLLTSLLTSLLIPLLLLPAAQAETLTAKRIVALSNDRDDGDNRISDMTMTLADRNGKTRVRTIRSFEKDKGEDNRRIMFFLSPADVEGTGFLTYDYDESGKDDDQWLYLPALQKSKRIASSDKSGSFMGSDFNYSDMTRPDIDEYEFRILKEKEVRGAKTWMIEAVPRTREHMEETGYKKSILFIRQDNFVMVRAIHWTLQGNKIKYQDVPGLELIDGIWTVTRMSMTTKKGKQTLHRTLLNFSNIRYNQKLAESDFTVRRLEMGF